jgi:hypothetical protein
MKERLLAVLGAICLIAAAVLVRQWLTDRGDDDAGGGGSGSNRPVVACTVELADVCDALAAAGAIAADPPELDSAGAATPDDQIDAWITWDPAPQLAGYDADGRTPTATWTEVEVLATAALAAAAQAETFAEACGAEVTWTCLAESGAADQPTTTGVGEPATAEGSARLLPLARALSEDDDPGTTDDIALRALLDGPIGGQRSAETMATLLVTRPAEVDVVIGPSGLLEAAAATTRGRDLGVAVRSPAPEATIAVVVASRTEGVARRLAERCDDAADALEAAGLTSVCEGGDTTDDRLAGFLWQVRERVR